MSLESGALESCSIPSPVKCPRPKGLEKRFFSRLIAGGRLSGTGPGDTFTAAWWYARFPRHYAGDGRAATKQLGELYLDYSAAALVKTLRAIKTDKVVPALQERFFEEAKDPLEGAR